ncbi:glutamine amidotransferase [Rouxiella badensis]|uniref:glutamine amidotransferase n=1 Tax=Rouxiella badensis TaxID=1646377 RepID=UPI0017887CCE|nr:glutamine amidotransferase [Rouxiella badensis]MCC3704108.1 glutamine amidotransferase [Rouxiella badensis]QOI56607.1 glutamine amidotransferase [Rouxiella badensis subsp. acadiensis]WAT05931.1 glutamine amidotransferase [Rouxiella badensis]
MSQSPLKPLLILQTGQAPDPIRAVHGNFPQMFIRQGNIDTQQVVIIDLQAGERPLPPQHYAGAVITGSRSMVTEHLDWSEDAADWIRQAMLIDLPMLGACYGHQLMAYALGGTVDYHPQGIEVGTEEIELLPAGEKDALVSSLPSRFNANLIHLQTVLTPPTCAKVLARSSHDPHQILRYGPNAFSTQFHPEFSAAIMKTYLPWLDQQAPDDSVDYAAKLQKVSDTPLSQGLLLAFVESLGKQRAMAG